MSQLGRISGPLLKADLIRDGVDLAFETDLLYLSVEDPTQPLKIVGVGINTDNPQYQLDVNGTTRSTDLQVTNQLSTSALTFSGNTISSNLGIINIQTLGDSPTIYQSKLQVDDIQIFGNEISTTVSNSNLELSANGTGTVEISSTTNIAGDLNVSGNVNVTGDVTIGGNITIGNDPTDTVTIVASIQSDIKPNIDDTWSLGTSDLRWKNLYVNNLYTDNLNINILQIGDLSFTDNQITSAPGQDIELSGNGAGGVVLGNFRIFENTVTNFIPGAISIFAQSSTGYFKIAGTNGFVPPIGSDTDRPTSYAEIGMTRYNTVSKALEIWDGSDWASPAGTTGAVNEITAIELAATYAITLG